MASNKDSAIERARQYAAAGQFDQAIESWRQVLDKSLNDANVYETIGDLYVKTKAAKEASEAYTRAAQLFLQQGLHPKVIAIYKKLLKAEPDRADLHERAGGLYDIQGLKNEAIAEYLAGSKQYLQAGKRVKALSLFRKITQLDPHNTSVRMRVAEICLQEHRMNEAIEEYMRIGDEYLQLQKEKEARALYEKVLTLSPNHPEARRRLERPYQAESHIPDAVPSTDEKTVPPVETEAQEVELETESVPLEVIIPQEGQPREAQVGGIDGTIEFNPKELEGSVVSAGIEDRAAATPTEAIRLLEAGDIAQAERVIRTLLLNDPEKNEYLALLGLVYLQKDAASAAYEILFPVIKTWVAGEPHP